MPEPTSKISIGAQETTGIRKGSAPVSSVYAGSSLVWGLEPPSPGLPQAVAEVIAEATRSNTDPNGRPLPLASSWETGLYKWSWAPPEGKPGTFNDPAAQLALLNAGHHWLPSFQFPPNVGAVSFDFDSYWSSAWDTLARWGVPFTMLATQWESALYTKSQWFTLPAAQNPNVIRASDQLILSKTDPQGPQQPWYEAGQWWMGDGSNGWENLQTRYPDPPKVIFLSNNEGSRLSPSINDANNSQRYIDAYGTETSYEERKEHITVDYSVRFNLLFDGMQNSMERDAPVWAQNSVMIGYNAVFAWYYARYGGWWDIHPYFPGNIDYEKNSWEGASPEYYLNPWQGGDTPVTDYTVFSPQTEFMNTKWQLDLVYATHPEFWYEMSIWDGYAPDEPTYTYKNKRYWYETQSLKEINSGILGTTEVSTTDTDATVTVDIDNTPLNVGDLLAIDETLTVGGLALKGVWQITEVVSAAQIRFEHSSPATSTDSGGNVSYRVGNPDLFTPVRYKAWIQYGMWLTFPRVVRDFRFWDKSIEESGTEYFDAFLEAVDDVYGDPVKTRFWREGTVVANTSRTHPYTLNTRAEYDEINKWFNLTTDVDLFPQYPPVYLTTEVPVWTLALVIGEAPNREWLVYAYSPKQDRTDVQIAIPDYGDIKIDVPQAGVFHYISEQ